METWGNFDALIKKDALLGGRVETAFYVYPTALVRPRILSRWKSLTIPDLALGLKTEIDHRFSQYDQILLVCHSLGGLVAKQLLCDQIKRSSSPRVKGVIFFATPHSGATLAAVADAISREHSHLRQLRNGSEFISDITRDWASNDCESKLDVTYVIGGQDAIVSRNSAAPPGTLTIELVADKGHIEIVKPKDDGDISYLIVKDVASKVFFGEERTLSDARTALANRDGYALAALVANRGRSWIETTEASAAVELLRQITVSQPPNSVEAVWSRYLIALYRLLRDRETSSTAFDEQLIRDAEPYGLVPLIRAEMMEFARKRGDRDETINLAATLLETIRVAPSTAAGSPYALGTAHFLLGNLYRYGGQYGAARSIIKTARTFFRPSILAHEIELAHCQYALAVCAAVQGETATDDISSSLIARELRRFAAALMTLTLSHVAWSRGMLGDAVQHAEAASKAFDQIGFFSYAKRARSLYEALSAWQRLELGAPLEKAISHTPEQAPIIRGLIGDKMARGALTDWISQTRPSRVLGMLQFASAYGADWTQSIDQFQLPPVLVIGDRFEWRVEKSHSLADADKMLRTLMGLRGDIRVPLIAD